MTPFAELFIGMWLGFFGLTLVPHPVATAAWFVGMTLMIHAAWRKGKQLEDTSMGLTTEQQRKKSAPRSTGKRKGKTVAYYLTTHPMRKLRRMLKRNQIADAQKWAESRAKQPELKRVMKEFGLDA